MHDFLQDFPTHPSLYIPFHLRKINLSHLALGLMTGIACLPIFGADRPMFWRESASGVRVSAFFLARVTVAWHPIIFLSKSNGVW